LTWIGSAAPIGLLTGFAAWLIAGGASANLKQVDGLQTRLTALAIPVKGNGASFSSGLDANSPPLFALTTGPGAIREPSIRVDGISMSRRRVAALVSIDTATSSWMTIGESRSGVTLQAVSATKVTVETAVGIRDLSLGDQSAASAPAGESQTPLAAASIASDQPPPGYRMPPVPADAPAH
jgi:hypothetical protein